MIYLYGGEYNKMIFQKLRKGLDVRVVTFVVSLIFATVLVIWACGGFRESEESIAKRTLPDIHFGVETGFIPREPDTGIKIPATTGITLKAGQLDQKINLSNPEENDCVIVVSIYLADGTLIYKSQIMRPGDSITDAHIQCIFRNGVFKNALLVYRCYTNDDTLTPISQCEIPIEIYCS